MTTSETALLDTNVIVYAVDDQSPFYQPAKALCEKGLRGEISIGITPQVVHEFLAIITDPRRTHSPLPLTDAIAEISKFIQSPFVSKIYPTSLYFDNFLSLLKKYNISKQDVFDTQLVAVMLSNNVTKLFTYNRSDFEIYREIDLLPL